MNFFQVKVFGIDCVQVDLDCDMFAIHIQDRKYQELVT